MKTEANEKIEQLLIEAWKDGHDMKNKSKGSIDYDADLECFLEQKQPDITALCEGNNVNLKRAKCNKHGVKSRLYFASGMFALTITGMIMMITFTWTIYWIITGRLFYKDFQKLADKLPDV